MYPLIIHSSDMKTDELLDMISSIARKKNKIRGNLRIEVLLEETFKKIDKELKQKQLRRKRKWDEMKIEMCKKARLMESCADVTSTKIRDDDDEDDPFELNSFFQRLKSATPNVPEVVTAWFHCSVSRESHKMSEIQIW